MSAAILIGVFSGCVLWFSLLLRDELRARRHFRPGPKIKWKFWLRKREAWQRFKGFPDFLELLWLGLSSGLTLDRAWEESLRFLPPGPLRVELLRTVNDFSLGRPRREALEDLIRRLKDDRLSAPLVLIGHALAYGTPLEGVLLDQARRLRNIAMMVLERRAQTAGIRLLFPVVFFILPTLFIILFGPLVLGFLETGRLF